MIRSLQSELVDHLPADHPKAIRTRRDLIRINTLMGHVGILARALKFVSRKQRPLRIVEIGAGDGEILLRVARCLGKNWSGSHITLVDLQDLLRSETKAGFAALCWQVRSMKGDVFKWMSDTVEEKSDCIFGNLVLHHFTDSQLTALFSMAARKADAFIALEPRRGGWPLFCAERLALIGCNAVTSHDAPISVRAGFTGRELSALWPGGGAWELIERRAGLFSHLFIARRKI